MRSYVEFGRTLLLVFGYTLIGLGTACLLYLAIIVFQIIDSPEQVRIVEFVLKYIPSGDRAAYGHIGQQPFELNLGQSVRTVLFLLIGMMILTGIASIARALITGGIELLRIGNKNPHAPAHEEDERNTVTRNQGLR